jgi:hypothetical protein
VPLLADIVGRRKLEVQLRELVAIVAAEPVKIAGAIAALAVLLRGDLCT